MLLTKLSTMMIMLIDFFEVETKLRSYLFPEALLKVSDLTWILQMSTHTSDNSSTLLHSKLLLEEVGVSSVEGLLHLSYATVIISLLSISYSVMDIDRFCFIYSSLLL